MKRQITSIILAWLIFIGIDFFFHASLFESVWKEDLPAIKSLDNLALLIPAGYLSFLLLTALIGFLFFRIFKDKPSLGEVLKFGFIFSILYALINLLGLYSYVEIPLKQLVLFNLVYFIETFAVSISIYYTMYATNLRKSFLFTIIIFVGFLIAGIIIQNIFQNGIN
jgi:hypothetical protein